MTILNFKSISEAPVGELCLVAYRHKNRWLYRVVRVEEQEEISGKSFRCYVDTTDKIYVTPTHFLCVVSELPDHRKGRLT